MPFFHDDLLDLPLNEIKNTAIEVCLCSQQPADYTEATVTYMLAKKTVGSSDFTLADVVGGNGGRKITVGQIDAIPATSDGTATDVAYVTATKLLTSTPLAVSGPVVNGASIKLNPHDISLNDAVSV